jgi:hypothetical protein
VIDGPDTEVEEAAARDRARKRVEKRRNLQGGLVAYLVVNAFLVGVWAMTGGGYFWPAWIIGGWGVGMLIDRSMRWRAESGPSSAPG